MTNPGKPLLLGILVDVSSSMAKQLRDAHGQTLKRLERVQESLDDLVMRARAWREEHHSEDTRRFSIFAYAFGMGNILDVLLARNVPGVANLLSDDPTEDCLVSSDDLLDRWDLYRNRIGGYSLRMGGTTPMVLALERAEKLMTRELITGTFEADSVLLILSDGLPTDGGAKGPDIARTICDRLKQRGVTILSCYISNEDVTIPRTLYAQLPDNWSPGARLMFECASKMPGNSVFWPHLHEHDWTAPPGARLFTQVNQSEVLREFVETVLGPIEQSSEPAKRPPKARLVFVSYSHADREYVVQKPGSLLYYLRGLEHEGIHLWWDDKITPGARWDAVIREKLTEATVALVLVSQAFLTSEYCTNVEIETFISRRKESGLKIIPIILSACEWNRHDWLSETQALPRDGKTVESNYVNTGRRKELYLEILRCVRSPV